MIQRNFNSSNTSHSWSRTQTVTHPSPKVLHCRLTSVSRQIHIMLHHSWWKSRDKKKIFLEAWALRFYLHIAVTFHLTLYVFTLTITLVYLDNIYKVYFCINDVRALYVPGKFLCWFIVLVMTISAPPFSLHMHNARYITILYHLASLISFIMTILWIFFYIWTLIISTGIKFNTGRKLQQYIRCEVFTATCNITISPQISLFHPIMNQVEIQRK